ncbi:hypothetical protein ABID22_001121 [Pontibacter aydingkolensis]|uniref:PepSY domain-containing protein n=1 Tax=Pontibacter aydingkolensis TaxID=1911536 RepID=A0ABS7CT89_9BACT|nr:hypothetical protein [Pontibacter aydingkolensis]MBW7467030.1 hypothetical protein [Pontibacter aydingkolensis]
MNKVFALALVLVALGLLTEAKAQAPLSASSQLPEGALQGVPHETGKEQIATDELPKAVKQALQAETLKEWNVSEVYLIKGTVQKADPKPMYEVYFTNAEQKKTVARFYKNGKTVSGKR